VPPSAGSPPAGAAGGDGGGRPLRVLQLITTLARGGAQATVLASADPADLADRRVEVTVLAGVDATGEGSYWDDQAIERLRIEPVPDLVRPLRPGSDARALRWLIARLRADPPDVVHTHSSKAGVLGRLAARVVGLPCVHTVHGWGPVNAGRGPARVAAIGLERFLAQRSAALVVVGEGDRTFGLANRIGRPEQYRLIRSGIELDRELDQRGSLAADPAARDRLRARLGLDDRFVVGMVGRLAPQKDQLTLIEAVARAGLARSTLVLVGDGPRRADLERAAAGRPDLDIRFLGARPDGARLVRAFDVAVNASRWEGLPRVVVEAAAAGVPVVASDVGSTGELVENGRTGWLVPPADPDALADAIAEIAADPGLAEARAEEARRRVGAYSADRMRDDLVALWWEVAGRAAPSADADGPVDRRGPAGQRTVSSPR
jgi:glycosyltransferase involved in cell wall biosynthesis